jgi:predicted dehydrogenase
MGMQFRVGVIGTGLAFKDLHLPVIAELSDRLRVVATSSRTLAGAEAGARAVAEATGLRPEACDNVQQLLARPDVDGVLIAVPINLTAGLARQALLAGKAVFAEKPLADDVAEARALLDLARSKGLVLFVGENYRYQRQYRQFGELAASGLIGTPVLFRLNDLHFTSPQSKYATTAWRRQGTHRGGYLLDGGLHTIAGMRSVVPSPVTAVHGLATSFHPEFLARQNDTLLLHLTFAGGMIGDVGLGYGAVDHEGRRPKIYGPEGTLVLFQDRIELWRANSLEPAQRFPVEHNGPGFREEWLDFHGAAAEHKPLAGKPEDALLDAEIILAGIESARTGEVVRL